jgi:hypothetical protein
MEKKEVAGGRFSLADLLKPVYYPIPASGSSVFGSSGQHKQGQTVGG